MQGYADYLVNMGFTLRKNTMNCTVQTRSAPVSFEATTKFKLRRLQVLLISSSFTVLKLSIPKRNFLERYP